ncbi:TadE/TadG family type IV pilus assembly protein [Oceanobacillus chungangensis]|uniref:Pilus assembly protein TadE n=1 Tax=Oceanobacillus chungangensis TaxID=1229152 RepID=A0A3D8Q1I9_9BACI|nr:pilus assembly protein [Oceanobacillus chungangensis]RDW21717.1 hypothetical protein CWR45_02260 [Oceanobacillus chungangensis]
MNNKLDLQKLKRDEEGAFTIEATMLFPIILIIVLLFVFFTLVIYEKVTIHYEANAIASAMAYSWNNSSADVDTGEFPMTEYTTMNGDGLYWRLTGNNFLNKFGLGSGGNDLVGKKTGRISGYDAEINLNQSFLISEIEVKIDKQLALPSSVVEIFGGNTLTATAKQPITEPAELIRNTDFVIYGTEKIAKYGSYIFEFMNKNKAK